MIARYQRRDKVLVLALMETMVYGAFTRKVKRMTENLCGREFSESAANRLARGFDKQVEAWKEQPMEDRGRPWRGEGCSDPTPTRHWSRRNCASPGALFGSDARPTSGGKSSIRRRPSGRRQCRRSWCGSSKPGIRPPLGSTSKTWPRSWRMRSIPRWTHWRRRWRSQSPCFGCPRNTGEGFGPLTYWSDSYRSRDAGRRWSVFNPTTNWLRGCFRPFWPDRTRTNWSTAGVTSGWTTTSTRDDGDRPPRRVSSRRPDR